MATYVVAGGTSGIGLAIAQALHQQGDTVEVYSRKRGEQLDSAISHHAIDLVDESSEISDLPDTIQGAIYCPGSINLRSFQNLGTEDFLKDLELNFLGAIRFLQACRKPLLEASSNGPASSVVMFSTVAVSRGMSMHSSVASSKGAVEGLVRSLAAEWAPRIRVNAIAPSLVDTPLASRFLSSEDKQTAMAKRHPLNKVGQPQDISQVANYLLSPASSWVTGQVFGIDGGISTLQV